jgi:hypothetical protein
MEEHLSKLARVRAASVNVAVCGAFGHRRPREFDSDDRRAMSYWSDLARASATPHRW